MPPGFATEPGQYFGSQANTIAGQREQSPITGAMEMRAKLQAALNDSIARLEQRLQPILSPREQPPQPNGVQKAQERNHAQEIVAQNQHLEHMMAWVNNIISRIEL